MWLRAQNTKLHRCNLPVATVNNNAWPAAGTSRIHYWHPITWRTRVRHTLLAIRKASCSLLSAGVVVAAGEGGLACSDARLPRALSPEAASSSGKRNEESDFAELFYLIMTY
eukprot:1397951-Pleurochrysis_carterae.AAC.8